MINPNTLEDFSPELNLYTNLGQRLMIQAGKGCCLGSQDEE